MIKIGVTKTCLTLYADSEIGSHITDTNYILKKAYRNENGHLTILLCRDHKGARWGIDASGRHRIQFRQPNVLKHMGKFGATEVKSVDLSESTSLRFTLPEDSMLRKMRVQNRSKGRRGRELIPGPDVLLPLQELVPMINAHKLTLEDKLTLRINNETGTLEATLTYF